MRADRVEPVAVTRDKIKDTIVADQFLKPAEICKGPAASACAQAGIT